jgi:uncharacterized membrane protein (DUF4010 family)
VPESLLALLVATLGGAAVGVERQWSGHATGPQARFAGVRTFALLGALGGIAGRLWVWEAPLLAVVLLLLAGLLVPVGYLAASRQDVDATTEAAALVVVGAGATAGLGETGVASGIVAVTALLLFEKSRLHDFTARLQGPELSAAFRFAVMAVVILPLLPVGPIGTLGGGLRPRELWMLVLLFSGLSFLGYLAQRAIGVSRGYVVAGLLGGMVSSTSVTLAFARRSREHPELARPLSLGVVAANTVLYVRVLVAAAILSPPLAFTLAPALVAPGLIGLVAAWSGVRRPERPDAAIAPITRNPLQLRSALEMTVLFQVVLILVALIGGRFGTTGLLGTAVVVGLNDVDALTLSMAREVGQGSIPVTLAARAVSVGLLSNTMVKLALAIGAGEGRFRSATTVVLLLMGAALAVAGLAMASS